MLLFSNSGFDLASVGFEEGESFQNLLLCQILIGRDVGDAQIPDMVRHHKGSDMKAGPANDRLIGTCSPASVGDPGESRIVELPKLSHAHPFRAFKHRLTVDRPGTSFIAFFRSIQFSIFKPMFTG